mmetsp:Transcript_97086/g.274670  ORF Transcript_97086/g.274670 Transcript_97086/m.274670 type:complete len:564 (-) Transcript_97086:457-2148(-)
MGGPLDGGIDHIAGVAHQACDPLLDHALHVLQRALGELGYLVLQALDGGRGRVPHHHVDEALGLAHNSLDSGGNRVDCVAGGGRVVEAHLLESSCRVAGVVGEPLREFQCLWPREHAALHGPLGRRGRAHVRRGGAAQELVEQQLRGLGGEAGAPLLHPVSVPGHQLLGDACLALALEDRGEGLQQVVVHEHLARAPEELGHGAVAHALDGLRRPGAGDGAGVGDPLGDPLHTDRLIGGLEALRQPVRRVGEQLQCRERVLGVQVVHLADEICPHIGGGELVGVVDVEAELHQHVARELERQAPVAQPLSDPANLCLVLGAHELQVVHDCVRHLVPLPRTGHHAGDLRQPIGVGPQDHRHRVGDGWVVDHHPQLLHREPRVAVQVVLADQLLRQAALQSGNGVQPRDVLKVLRGYKTRVGHIEEVERLVEELILVVTVAVELCHDLVEQLLDTVHRDTEHRQPRLDFVAELENQVANLLEGRLELLQQLGEQVGHLIDHRIQDVMHRVQDHGVELRDGVGDVGPLPLCGGLQQGRRLRARNLDILLGGGGSAVAALRGQPHAG